MNKKVFFFLFILSVTGVLAGIILHEKWFEYVFKPLIMISLGGLFFTETAGVSVRIKVFAGWAFLFSLLGDTFLMFTGKNQLFFMAGLGSFLVSQIGYIFLFQHSNKIEGIQSWLFLKKHQSRLFLYFVYGTLIYCLLFPNLDPVLKVAVFIYMVALLGMSVMALNRKGTKPVKSFQFVFIGSLLFVISDSVIAINKFLVSVPNNDFIVMSTYMAAQFLIVRGLILQFTKKG